MIGFPTTETWQKFFSEKTKDLQRYRRYTFYKGNRLREIFPNVSDLGLDFLMNLLVWDPKVVDSDCLEKNVCSKSYSAPLLLRKTATEAA